VLERGRLLKLDGPSIRTQHLGLDAPAHAAAGSPHVARISGIDSPEFPEPTGRFTIEPRPPPVTRSSSLAGIMSRSPARVVPAHLLRMLTVASGGAGKRLRYLGPSRARVMNGLPALERANRHGMHWTMGES